MEKISADRRRQVNGAPNLNAIPEQMRHLAMEAWEQGDALGITCLAGHADRGQLLFDNIQQFRKAGIYEKALFKTFIHGPTMPPDNWQFLFSFADLEKLHACGGPVPTFNMTVFRGVNNCRQRRWIRGPSWTSNPSTAAWFASRFTFPDANPALYSVCVRPEHVLFVTNDRSEEEVVVAIWQCSKIKRVSPMPAAIKPGSTK